MDYNPRELFQLDVKRRAWWAEIAASSDFHTVIAATQAIQVYKGKDALHDVNDFIRTMVNLSLDEAPPKQMPNKHLTSFDQPYNNPTTTK